MIAKKILEEISSKLGDTIAQSPAKDIEKNVKSLMGSAFNRMDLVTREEFDIQQQVLIKTRELLTQLEQRVAVLEAAQTTADTTVEEAVQTAEAPAAEAAQEARGLRLFRNDHVFGDGVFAGFEWHECTFGGGRSPPGQWLACV